MFTHEKNKKYLVQSYLYYSTVRIVWAQTARSLQYSTHRPLILISYLSSFPRAPPQQPFSLHRAQLSSQQSQWNWESRSCCHPIAGIGEGLFPHLMEDLLIEAPLTMVLYGRSVVYLMQMTWTHCHCKITLMITMLLNHLLISCSLFYLECSDCFIIIKLWSQAHSVLIAPSHQSGGPPTTSRRRGMSCLKLKHSFSQGCQNAELAKL